MTPVSSQSFKLDELAKPGIGSTDSRTRKTRQIGNTEPFDFENKDGDADAVKLTFNEDCDDVSAKRKNCTGGFKPEAIEDTSNGKNNKACGYESDSQMLNDAFVLKFDDQRPNMAKCSAADADKITESMFDTIRKKWVFNKPAFILSVNGSDKDISMNKHMRYSFRCGLRKTALRTGAWIVTCGKKSGVAKLVGQAVKECRTVSSNRVQAIGIVQNLDKMLQSASKREREIRENDEPLDPNHFHFVTVVDAKQRAKLEKELTKIKNENDVPIVHLVLEGGPETLEAVYHALQNNTPTVVVKGTKGAAFVLAYAYLNSKEKHEAGNGRAEKSKSRYMEDSIEQNVRGMVEQEFGPNNIPEKLDCIKKCLQKGDLMSVFELDINKGFNEIDVAMLQAVLRATNYQIMDKLRLALAWNRIDLAKSDIFTDVNHVEIGNLDGLMLGAIQLYRVDFIRLFLDHGVSLKRFLTKERLCLLYKGIPKNCLCWSLLEKIKLDRKNRNTNDHILTDVKKLVDSLMGDTLFQDTIGYAIDQTDCFHIISETGFKHPHQQLFIWSILLLQQDMAKLFWTEGKDKIAAALTGYKLLKRLKSQTDNTQFVNAIQGCLNTWSELAVAMLGECHAIDEHKTQDLLIRKVSCLGDTSCFLIALTSDNMDFFITYGMSDTPEQCLEWKTGA
ncbi:transient receptor potential cation channel subfamily M member-like 2 [Dreissena polymorpha]|uniref:transient receptor potential cation channel subfamily M member-like 2 n=1 Tax=Dreissena polymorpha TaxID=45954 RepID=UPI002263CD44|nr:transient receptor potential cation channel subfamily M member-like 2 [Dreissena polymorpha]